jgi:3-deoxy-D-arabino-heptulosonate 7-phosphate (DAHP) synthase class II
MKQRVRTKFSKIIESRLGSQKVTNSLNESIRLFQVRTMTALWETDPFDLAWNLTEERLHGDILSFIVVAVD